jgi:hypothetical protein
MPIRRLLKDDKFEPEQVAVLTRAFDLALNALYLIDRDDPICEIVARKLSRSGLTASTIPERSPRLLLNRLVANVALC